MFFFLFLFRLFFFFISLRVGLLFDFFIYFFIGLDLAGPGHLIWAGRIRRMNLGNSSIDYFMLLLFCYISSPLFFSFSLTSAGGRVG